MEMLLDLQIASHSDAQVLVSLKSQPVAVEDEKESNNDNNSY